MRILVTGSAGFIGSNFVRYILENHPDVSVFGIDALKPQGGDPFFHQKLETNHKYNFYEMDILDEERAEFIMRFIMPDIIFHFAAESHVDRSNQSPRNFIMTNFVGTFNIIDAFRCINKEGMKRFVYISTDEVYGSHNMGEPEWTEESRFLPNNPYSASKAGGNHIVRAYHKTYGMDTITTLSSNNFGPNQFYEKLVPRTIISIIKGKNIPLHGDGGQFRDWLFVKDNCHAIWLSGIKGTSGESYNIAGGHELRNIEIVHKICDIMSEHTGVDCRNLIKHVADRPSNDAAYRMDSMKIRKELGWKPEVDFDIALRQTILWYMAPENRNGFHTSRETINIDDA